MMTSVPLPLSSSSSLSVFVFVSHLVSGCQYYDEVEEEEEVNNFLNS